MENGVTQMVIDGQPNTTNFIIPSPLLPHQDLGSNATPTSILVATTVTQVSDYSAPESSPVADVAPTPAPVENVPTPNVQPAQKRMSNATPNSVSVADAAPTTTPVVNILTTTV